MADPTGLQEYIGDGVYVEFDGYGIWLRANHPNSDKAVYLEPPVLDNLNRFAKHVFNRKNDKKEPNHAMDPRSLPGRADQDLR